MNVRIENLTERSIVRVRQTGPYQESSCRAWNILCAWAGPKGLLTPGTTFIGIGHDDPSVTAPDAIRYDAAITLIHPVKAEPPVIADTMPGGEYAVVTHKGPYARLEDTYRDVMGQWLPQSGREVREAAPCFEVYLNDPEKTPEAELLTDVYVPLK